MSKQATAQQITSDTGITFKKPTIVPKEGETETKFISMAKLDEGATVVEGIYLGSAVNERYAPKLDFKFKTADGQNVVVNEGGNLKFRMSTIAAGTLVRVIYNGLQTMTKGKFAGKKTHNVDVLVAE